MARCNIFSQLSINVNTLNITLRYIVMAGKFMHYSETKLSSVKFKFNKNYLGY